MSSYSNKNIYHYFWKATCPRCGKILTQNDFKCKNCYRGTYQIEETNDDDYTYISGYSCNVCHDKTFSFYCPDCNADVTNQIRRDTGGGFFDTLFGWLIIIGIILVISFILYLIVG